MFSLSCKHDKPEKNVHNDLFLLRYPRVAKGLISGQVLSKGFAAQEEMIGG